MFYERLKALCRENGITVTALLKELDLSPSKGTAWKNGATPKGDKLLKIAERFQVTTDFLLGDDKTKSTPQNREVLRIPVFGKVAAGVPMAAIEDILDYEEVWKDEYSDGEYMALQIKGSSMEPKFSEGDVVIVKLQPDVDSGQIAVMIINGDEATVKRLVKHKEGIALVSTNPTYDPMYFSNKEIEELPIKVFGRVVELRAKF